MSHADRWSPAAERYRPRLADLNGYSLDSPGDHEVRLAEVRPSVTWPTAAVGVYVLSASRAVCCSLRLPAYDDGGRGVAIQPRFDAHGSQRFPGGEQEHPERIRVQLGQPVHSRQRGRQVINLIGQRDQILGSGYGRSPPRSGAAIVCTSLGSYHAVSMTHDRVCVF
jgi:hypothetical protein